MSDVRYVEVTDAIKSRRIKYFIAMFSKDVTEEQLAKKLGVTRGMIGHVVTGRRKSKKLEQCICRELGLNYEEMYKEVM